MFKVEYIVTQYLEEISLVKVKEHERLYLRRQREESRGTGPAPLMAKMGVDCCRSDDPVHPLPAVYTELAKLVMSNLERLDDKVERSNAKVQRTGGFVREWRDRRGGHWGRGGGRSGGGGYGGRWAGRGGRGRFSV